MAAAIQVGRPRGVRLAAAVLTAVLLTLFACASSASAAVDPIGSGSAAIGLDPGFVATLKQRGVTIRSSGTAAGDARRTVFPVERGIFNSATGKGAIKLDGGFRFKRRDRSAAVEDLVVNTAWSGLYARVANRHLRLAGLVDWSHARRGFGAAVTVESLKLNRVAARVLNAVLGFERGSGPFRVNQIVGRVRAEEQPRTAAIVPGGEAFFDADPTTLAKLAQVKVETKPIAPTTAQGPASFESPIGGGRIAPDGDEGLVKTSGGIVLVQRLATGAGSILETKVTLWSFRVDLAARTVSAETAVESNASDELNRGALGLSSLADLTPSTARIDSDPLTRTVSMQRAGAALQPVAAEVLNGFVRVYENYLRDQGKSAEEARQEQIVAGDPRGTFSLTAQTR
jgi:hypothetical protein